MLGSYQLVLRVAIGGMGEIWAARMKRGDHFDRIVALKTILPELSYQANFETMFLDEARLAGRIDHPNVVKILDVGEHESVLYQVMEWVSGTTLWALLRAAKGEPMPLEVAGRILYQMCAGLHAAHELKDETGKLLGLVHRDVSPQNVLLTEDGLVKIVDFGVAKYAGRGVAETQKGELRGKVPFMAPEHILGQALDRRADVFALGTVFFQMLTGHHPHLRTDDLLTLAAISSPEPAPPLSKHLPGASPGLTDLIARATEKSPEKRTMSALALMKAIAREIPAAAQLSTNQLVSDYVRELLGDKKDVRTMRIEAALRRLEAPPESANAPRSRIPSDEALTPLPATPVTETLQRGTDDPIELPVAPRSSGRTVGIVLGAFVAMALGGAIALSVFGGAPVSQPVGDLAAEVAPASPPPARPAAEPSVEPAPVEPSTEQETATGPTPAPGEDDLAASEPSAAPTASAKAPPFTGGGYKKPPPPPGEFLPDGL